VDKRDSDHHGDKGLDQWRRVRRYLGGHRHELTRAADALYPGLDRVPPTPLLCLAGWLAPEPVSLADVKLTWNPEAPPPRIDGTEPQARAVHPAGAGGRRFADYADALTVLDPPRLLENRICYRLTSVTCDGGAAAMTFGPSSYFAGINVGEAVAHEFAAWHMSRASGPRLPDLPLRDLVGNPADLTCRSVNPAISMLTLRRNRAGAMTFLLHHRDPAQVVHAGGLYQVIPVGMFQPSSDTSAALRNDFDLWRCAVREYSEELLGAPETYGDGVGPFDYDAWPLYRALAKARDDGSLRSHLLGIGVDPLSLAADILAVTVIDADVFDEVFDGLVASNNEGQVLGHGTPGLAFTHGNVERFAAREPMQAAGAALLTLAWAQREYLTAS
jgi:hypothetical protein